MRCSACTRRGLRFNATSTIRTARRWQAGQVFAFIPKGEGMPVPKPEELSGLARGANPEGYRDRTGRT